MIKHICNGCHREINDDSIIATNKEIVAWFEKNKVVNVTQTLGCNDAFCPICITLAHPYWDEKKVKLQELDRHITSTLRKHCKKFFQPIERGNEDQVATRPS